MRRRRDLFMKKHTMEKNTTTNKFMTP